MANEYISSLSGTQMDEALRDMAEHTSEAWATGTRNGLDVSDIDETYHNNAKYYAEQAARVVPEGTAAVRYDVAQVLTEEEQAQARANIGASAGSIRYDEPQDLTDEEQLQAQQNIGLNNVLSVTTPFASRITANGENIKDGLASIRAIRGRSEVVNDKIVDVTGVVSTGKNIWDEQWELGGIIYASGLPAVYTDRIRSKNFCRILPNTAYSSVGLGYTFFYDMNFNYISYVATATFTTPSNAHYFKIVDNNHTSYQNNIAIGIGLTEYEPYKSSSVLFPPMRSAKSIKDFWANGVYTRCVGVVDLGTLDWTYITSATINYFIANLPIKNTALAICGRYECYNTSIASTPDKALYTRYTSWTTTPQIGVVDSSYTNANTFKTAMNGVMLYYELATPEVVELPIPPYTAYKNGSEYVIGDGILDADIEYGVDIVKDLQDLATAMPQTVLLWENASPNSSFGGQIVNVDLTRYSKLLIVFHTFLYSNYAYSSGFYEVGQRGEYSTSMGTSSESAGSLFVYKRCMAISSNSITFENCNAATGSSTFSVDNRGIIPYRIYGIK